MTTETGRARRLILEALSSGPLMSRAGLKERVGFSVSHDAFSRALSELRHEGAVVYGNYGEEGMYSVPSEPRPADLSFSEVEERLARRAQEDADFAVSRAEAGLRAIRETPPITCVTVSLGVDSSHAAEAAASYIRDELTGADTHLSRGHIPGTTEYEFQLTIHVHMESK